MTFSRGIFSSTMTGAAPPCSSATRVPGASLERSIQPTLAEPMKEKNAVRGSVTICSATSSVQGTKRHQRSSRPASYRISTKLLQDNGVSLAGFTRTGHPVATAGPT